MLDSIGMCLLKWVRNVVSVGVSILCGIAYLWCFIERWLMRMGRMCE